LTHGLHFYTWPIISYVMSPRSFGASILISAALLLSSGLALAQFTQQGPKLVGTGAVGQAHQGGSVALSADGNTAIVGGNSDNGGNGGAAWVFTRSGGVWTQQGNKLVGTGAVGQATQGNSVALSADGNTAIVGGPNDNGSTGAVWVFTRSGGVWTPTALQPKVINKGKNKRRGSFQKNRRDAGPLRDQVWHHVQAAV
jgi:hypothetical protein